MAVRSEMGHACAGYYEHLGNRRRDYHVSGRASGSAEGFV